MIRFECRFFFVLFVGFVVVFEGVFWEENPTQDDGKD